MQEQICLLFCFFISISKGLVLPNDKACLYNIIGVKEKKAPHKSLLDQEENKNKTKQKTKDKKKTNPKVGIYVWNAVVTVTDCPEDVHGSSFTYAKQRH